MAGFTQIQQHQKFERVENRLIFHTMVKMTFGLMGENVNNAQVFFNTLWNLAHLEISFSVE